MKNENFKPKHAKETEKTIKKQNKSKKSKTINKKYITILLLIILLIIIILGYSLFIAKNNNNSNLIKTKENTLYANTNIENATAPTPSNVESVKGAEYLEIVKMKTHLDDDKSYTIITTLKNITNQSYQDIKLKMIFYDEDKTEIATFDYKIDKIEPLTEVPMVASTKTDISNYKTYEIVNIVE